jgi:hypothetical protein
MPKRSSGTSSTKSHSGSGGHRSGGGGHRRGRASSETRATVNRDDIRQWVQSRGGKPACVRGTGGGIDAGMLRIDFPGYSGQESVQEISWDEWFRAFERNGLAFLRQDYTPDGTVSRFNKLVHRSEVRVVGDRGGGGNNGRGDGGPGGGHSGRGNHSGGGGHLGRAATGSHRSGGGSSRGHGSRGGGGGGGSGRHQGGSRRGS